jgi:hypothetical protein
MLKDYYLVLFAVVVCGCQAPDAREQIAGGPHPRPAATNTRSIAPGSVATTQSAAATKWDKEWADYKRVRAELSKRVDEREAAESEKSKSMLPGETYEQYMARGHTENVRRINGIPNAGQKLDVAHDALENKGWRLQSIHTSEESTTEVWTKHGVVSTEFVYVTYSTEHVVHVSTSKVLDP